MQWSSWHLADVLRTQVGVRCDVGNAVAGERGNDRENGLEKI